MEFLGIEMPVEEFDRLICEQNKGKELVVENGVVTARYRVATQQELNEQRILQLKQLLADSDYKTLKFVEGELTAEEYEPTKLQRKQWREEIRQLGG